MGPQENFHCMLVFRSMANDPSIDILGTLSKEKVSKSPGHRESGTLQREAACLPSIPLWPEWPLQYKERLTTETESSRAVAWR